MGNSFQDQFLKLGLVDKKKINETKKQRHKAKKQQSKTGKKSAAQVVAEENAQLARQAMEKKKARARQLNRERDEKLQKRERAARIKQLIEHHKVEKDDNGVAFRFPVNGKIHRVFVTEEIAGKLSKGALGIVALDGAEKIFEVIPRDIVNRINEIDGSVFSHLVENSGSGDVDPDDPYAEYQVPDDLMW